MYSNLIKLKAFKLLAKLMETLNIKYDSAHDDDKYDSDYRTMVR